MSTEYSRRNTVKEFFSSHSGYWESLYNPSSTPQNFTQFEVSRRKEIVFSLISSIPRDGLNTALDLGCGAGHYLAQLAGMGLECTGADASEEMLNLTRKKLLGQANATLINSDCANLPIDDQSFDLIICIGLLEYLENEAEALQEIRRLIRPDGYAVVTFPNLYKLRNLLNPYYYLVRVWIYFLKGISLPSALGKDQRKSEPFDYSKATTTRYSLTKAKRIIKKSGFSIVEVRGCCFGPFSLWKESHRPVESSIRSSSFIEGLLKHKPLGFLKYFANRWVILIKPETTDDNG